MGEIKTNRELMNEVLCFYDQDEDDQTVKHLETPLGNFTTTYIYDSPEFIIRDYAYTYARDITLTYRTSTKNYIQIAFFLNQHVLKDSINNRQNSYLPQHNYIYFTPSESDVEIFFRKDIAYRNFDIYVESDYFHQFVAEMQLVDSFIAQVDKNNFVRLVEAGIPLSPQMLHILQEMKSCRKTGIQRQYFMKGRTMILLQLLFEWIDQEKKQSDMNGSYGETDANIFYTVQEFITKNTGEFYTIEQLAIKFGINEYKLKKGFKEISGMGLFQFATKVHIQEAISLLKTTDLSIKEIAFRTGYSSPSSFSVAFKKQYGIAPNQIRKKSDTVHEDKASFKRSDN
ncbi:AraC family transcriptional regulator [Sphingobacterium sp. BIGb0165]|uniref:helix-turn-helix domain-containing protein n=1 Tax=Sphingobacterium sp. BIGb0165 TaxID=2940615 RepID=UPI002168B5FA|nr:AraC family transcriptional regulator [Sphingobacterium sp. BIGb0165]MCS4226148.1 AraC-like DNA-binding protein [Sphingobacterium sp. BIGb0165]